MTSRLPSGTSRIEVLDALRGMAALMVCWHHTGTVIGQPPIVVYGFPGIYLFFALSGYLLFRPFVTSAFGDQPAPNIQNYFFRRMARIMPPYWIALGLFTFARYAMGINPPTAENFITHVFLCFNYWPSIDVFSINGVFWTLAVEVQFYLLLPIAAWIGRRVTGGGTRAVLVTVIVCLIAGPLARLIEGIVAEELYGAAVKTRYRCVISFLDLFGWGMFASYLERRLSLESMKGIGWVAFATGLVFVVGSNSWASLQAVVSWPENSDRLFALCYPIIVGIGMGLIVFSAPSSVGGTLLVNNRFLRFCGKVSYSVYLYHIGVQIVMFMAVARYRDSLGPFADYLHTGFTPGLVFLPIVLLVSWVMYLLIEKPSLALCERFRDRRASTHET